MPSEPQTLGKYNALISNIQKVFDSRGPEAGLTYVKAVRVNFSNYLSGNPERAPGVRCTSDGIPLVLSPWLSDIRQGSSPAVLRTIMTILYSTRALNLGVITDTKTITEPTNVVSPDISKFSKDFWRELGYKPSMAVPSALMWKKFHFSTKSGPNGHALFTSLADLYVLPETLIDSIKTIGGEKLKTTLSHLLHPVTKTLMGSILNVLGTKFRKITSFPDKEAKVRVIAQLDYFSQSALIPVHRYLYRVLRKIPQDCTFDQGSFWDKIKDSEDYYSIDLSAATDRFPMDLICQILEAKLPPSYVAAWRDVMVGYPFDFKGESLRYAVGNPMGAYSSWASFAVAHHYVIYYCCRQLGLDWKSVKYALLGDDIVIADKQLGERYHEVISSLGLEVSSLKTHKSKQFLEFAKRLMYKSNEITPFPISALKESQKRYYLLVNLLLEQERKGWVTCDGIPSSVARYTKVVRKLPSRLAARWESEALICEKITRVIQSDLTATEGITSICRHLDLTIPNYTEEEFLNILRGCVKEIFTESYDRLDRPGRGLGDYAISIVCSMTSWDSVTNAGGVQTEDIPVLQAYGLVEEMFLDMHRESSRITAECGDWPLWLKTMALPLDDRVFVEKQRHTVVRGSTILGKYLRVKLESIPK